MLLFSFPGIHDCNVNHQLVTTVVTQRRHGAFMTRHVRVRRRRQGDGLMATGRRPRPFTLRANEIRVREIIARQIIPQPRRDTVLRRRSLRCTRRCVCIFVVLRTGFSRRCNRDATALRDHASITRLQSKLTHSFAPNWFATRRSYDSSSSKYTYPRCSPSSNRLVSFAS
jgi:hypothetical protein